MSAGPLTRPLRVLIVEDDADDAALLERHLNRSGFAVDAHRVETAEGMLAALSESWDCVLADYNLPMFSAPQALRLLQGAGRDIPFIMMSGAVSEATAVAAMRAGAHDYVSKENLTRLVPAIERELAEAASRRLKRAAERALRSSEERFHWLVEATPLALLISDMDSRITYFNGSAERLLGLTQEELARGEIGLETVLASGEASTAFPPENPAKRLMGELRRKIEEKQSETWEAVCYDRERTEIPVLLGAAILNPEEPAALQQLALFIVDLREQKRSEEVLRRTEKLAAAGRLAASIAHEINNPLEAITNCMYLLEQGELDPASRGYLEMAQGELNRVTHITTQTLRFHRQSSRPTATALPDLLDSVLVRIRDHGIRVVRDYEQAPPIVALDGEIRQVLANVIGNAIDAMMGIAGPRTLVLRARPRRMWSSGDQAVALLVADRGSGIGKAALRRIFEPFFSTKAITGTGLGLWVCREIIAKHNGRIQVRTRQEAPCGTVFRLLLPLQSVVSEEPYEAGIPVLHGSSAS